MKKLKKRLMENKLRQYVRSEIRRIMEMDDESEAGTAEEPKKKPQPKPAPEKKDGLSSDFEYATSHFIGKLRSSAEPVEHEDLVDIMSTILNTFIDSNESKLNLLKAVKIKTVT